MINNLSANVMEEELVKMLEERKDNVERYIKMLTTERDILTKKIKQYRGE